MGSGGPRFTCELVEGAECAADLDWRNFGEVARDERDEETNCESNQ